MKSKIEIITPAYALEVLEKYNPRNRKITEATVQAYANDMKNGRWFTTHQGIAFNTKGYLIDGQHRLWAIIFSNKEVEMMVTRDIPESEHKGGVDINPMDTIDVGKVRSTGQQLQLCHSIKNGNVVAAACRGIVLLVDHTAGFKRLSTSNSLFVYELYGQHIEAVIDCLTTNGKRVSYITAPLSLYHKGEPEKAREFLKQYITMENMSAPVRAMAKYLESNHGKDKSGQNMRVVAQAVLKFHDNEPVSKLQDGDNGVKFLVNMFPSVTARIRAAVKPIEKCKIKDFKPEVLA